MRDAVTPEQKLEILAQYAAHGSAVKAAEIVGVHKRTAQRVVRAHVAQQTTGAPHIPGMEVDRVTTAVSPDGEVRGHSVRQRIEAGDPDPEGFELTGVSSFVDPDGAVRGEWRKYSRTRRKPEEVASAIREALEGITRAVPRGVTPLPILEGCYTVYVLPDLHIGLRSHGAETGADFDLKIASQMYGDAFKRLLHLTPATQLATTLFLGDVFHTDGQMPLTPAHKHLLDADGRWRKLFGTAALICCGMIEAAADRHPKVSVAVIPGNHDPDTTRALDVALQLRYDIYPRIDAPGTCEHHWFHRHGRNLIGATHGHTMKPSEMADLLINERRRDFGETDFHHVLFGHRHHETLLRARNGVLVEGFGAPCPRSSFEAAGGYPAGGRSLTSIVYHAEQGEIARYRAPLIYRP